MPKQAAILRRRNVRGSRSGRPIMALLDLLSRRWASPTIIQARLTELRSAHLVELVPGDGYRLTGLGKDLMENVLPLNRFAERWSKRTASQAAATVRLAPSA